MYQMKTFSLRNAGFVLLATVGIIIAFAASPDSEQSDGAISYSSQIALAELNYESNEDSASSSVGQQVFSGWYQGDLLNIIAQQGNDMLEMQEIIANNTRKPIWNYKTMVYSMIFLGFMSFLVWAHHMFQTGMGQTMSAFFQITTMIISVPSVVILSGLFITLWGSRMRFNTPMLFALSFLPMFGIGGLTGLPLGLAPSDIPLHDTYYVIGHFHYVVAPGTIFAIFAGIYFWFPKITGKKLNEGLGKIHFFFSLIFINGVFMPLFIQGLAGVSRRLADGGVSYAHAAGVLEWNEFMSVSAWLLGVAQIPFIINFFMTIFKKTDGIADPNPWQSTTIEWTDTTSPPLGHGNFETIPVVHRSAYDYSVEGSPEDFIPQTKK